MLWKEPVRDLHLRVRTESSLEQESHLENSPHRFSAARQDRQTRQTEEMFAETREQDAPTESALITGAAPRLV